MARLAGKTKKWTMFEVWGQVLLTFSKAVQTPLGLCVSWLKAVFEVVQSRGFDAEAVRWRFDECPEFYL
ncbi:MAG: hypothetical protein EBX62_09465, partial [Betaproteobacteria bacterium]|nr:hypothetical protein [Betaproteobacteria bacterium]